MIRWHLKALMEDRGVKAWRLADEMGMTRSAVYKLARRPDAPRRLKRETLDALCRALDCQPGDLLEHRKR